MLRVFLADLTLAIRFAVLGFSIVMGVVVLVACATLANAATLKTDVVLDGAVLTAADLFDGLDKDKGAKVLGPAPQPGQDMVLNTLTLMQVAAALNIDWKPQSTSDQITVRSASAVVDQDTISDALMKKLQEKGVSGKYSLSFFDAPKLVLPKNAPATVDVASITYHSESDRFEATIVGPSKEHPAGTIQVSGHVEHTMPVPMLKKAMRTGDIIRADDIEWKDMPVHAVDAGNLIDADKLIGKTPRHMVMADQPVRDTDLAEPMLVNRGQSVTILYAKGPITVTAKGRAMEDGARGATIRVVNSTSSRPIDARVSDDGMVTVTD